MTEQTTLAEELFKGIPVVKTIEDRKLKLDLGFMQELYDSYGGGACVKEIKLALDKAGFPVNTEGFTLGFNLAKKFGRSGRPVEATFITFCVESSPLLLPAQSEAQQEVESEKDADIDTKVATVAGVTSREDADPVPDEAPKEVEDSAEDCGAADERIFSDEELLKSGVLIKRGLGLALADSLEAKVLSMLPGISVVDALAAAGVPVKNINEERIQKLKRHFRTIVERDREGGQQAEAVDLRLSDEELLASGLFVANRGGLGFHPDFERTLYNQYPDKTIEEGLADAGFSPEQVGKARIARLKARFDRAGGKNPDFYTDMTLSELRADVIARYEKHPYVASCTKTGIILNERFMKEACHFRDLTASQIMQIFDIDIGLFSYQQRDELLVQLQGQVLVVSSEPSFQELTSFSPQLYQIVLNRIMALDWMVEREISNYRDDLPTMGAKEKRQLFQTLEELPKDPDGKYTVSKILEMLAVPRTTFYSVLRNETYGDAELAKQDQDEKDQLLIRRVMEYKGFRKGARQIYMLLPHLEGVTFALSKIRRLMKKYGLESGIRKPNPSRKGAQKHLKAAVAPNILRRRFRLFKPNQVLVTDVTYLTYSVTKERAYCSCIMDAVTNVVSALNISRNNDIDLVKESIRLVKENPLIEGCIIHSDQGVLYLSHDFIEEIEKMGLVRSMSRRGNCFDNSVVESFNGTMKEEVDYEACNTYEELVTKIDNYKYYYNNERRRWDRGKRTPVEYEDYLLSMSESEWDAYLHTEEERYAKMRARSAQKAKEKAKESMGVHVYEDEDEVYDDNDNS